jgi:hypothetical protein
MKKATPPLSSRSLLLLSFLVLALVTSTAALGGNLPSSKATVSLGEAYALGKALAEADPNSTTSAVDTGWVTISRSYIKTPNMKDLSFDVAMQCGLVTYTEVKSKGGNKDTSQASGTIRARVKVTGEDGTVRFAEPLEENLADNGVTYCHRFQTLSAVFQGIIENCIALDGTIDLTDECLEPEEVSLLIGTLNAAAFNFLLPDLSPGIQRIEVQARALASADLFDAQQGRSRGEAFVGVGSMRIETIRLIKDIDLGPIEVD